MKTRHVQVRAHGAPYGFGGELVEDGHASTDRGVDIIVARARRRLQPGQTVTVLIDGEGQYVRDERGNWRSMHAR